MKNKFGVISLICSIFLWSLLWSQIWEPVSGFFYAHGYETWLNILSGIAVIVPLFISVSFSILSLVKKNEWEVYPILSLILLFAWFLYIYNLISTGVF